MPTSRAKIEKTAESKMNIFKCVYNAVICLVMLVERAFVCVTTEPLSVQKVLDEIKAVGGVEEASMVFGVYDVCFEVKEESLDKLKRILTQKISRIDDVRATLTLFMAGPE